MSFLIDPPVLFGTGVGIESYIADRKKALMTEGVIATGFVITSISLYLDAKWTKPIWKVCGAKSGRDWMLNSGVFKFNTDKVSNKVHVVAAVLFASYPFWIHLGRKVGSKFITENSRLGNALLS
ncbi:MAG: hypothetical protein M1131_04505 [Actinobacteria bacterium]|jgi:hypothetical protein|nr:hypothetical protein [Actinomycetota bacterium]MCL6094683.1 hypothetical protein [Actinomycetota bacterium]